MPNPSLPESNVDADLESVGLTRERAATVRRFATAVATGGVVLDASHALDALVSGLCEIRGIGPWTAHYIAMRAGGERDAFPGADLGLRRALGGGRPITVRELERRAEFWRPWRAYAAVHLWAERARPLATRWP